MGCAVSMSGSCLDASVGVRVALREEEEEEEEERTWLGRGAMKFLRVLGMLGRFREVVVRWSGSGSWVVKGGTSVGARLASCCLGSWLRLGGPFEIVLVVLLVVGVVVGVVGLGGLLRGGWRWGVFGLLRFPLLLLLFLLRRLLSGLVF